MANPATVLDGVFCECDEPEPLGADAAAAWSGFRESP
jgi:hypothetical protein